MLFLHLNRYSNTNIGTCFIYSLHRNGVYQLKKGKICKFRRS